MMPGVVAGFPKKTEVPTSVAIPARGLGWSQGSPVPTATKLGTTVTLSGRFVAAGVAGTGDQQNAGVLPEGYRPSSELQFPVMVGAKTTTLTIQYWWGGLNLNLPSTMTGVLDLTGISFTTE